ncbi:winged helix-turn-helix domain-containing protein [Microbacterium sp. NPDC090218]
MTMLRPGVRPVLAGCRIVISDDARSVEAAPRSKGQAGSEALIRSLSEVGAEVWRVAVPRDGAAAPAALRRAVQRAGSGGVDAVLFLSSSMTWIETAERAGVLDATRRRTGSGRLLLAALDREEADRLRAARLPAAFTDEQSVTALARGVVAHYGNGSGSLVTDAGRLEVRSGGVVVDERFIPLSRGAAGVIEALFLAGGRVLSRAEIGRGLPGGERSGRAVEVAVARLRESLDGVDLVQTVVKRGYRLAVAEQ